MGVLHERMARAIQAGYEVQRRRDVIGPVIGGSRVRVPVDQQPQPTVRRAALSSVSTSAPTEQPRPSNPDANPVSSARARAIWPNLR
jgi:hypothetical protein